MIVSNSFETNYTKAITKVNFDDSRGSMGKEHHLAERRQAILNAVDQAGQLSVEELSALFDVSEVTIRQDLQALHMQNMLLRTRGGAVAINTVPELSFDMRQQQHAEKKARIGRAAAELIRPGDSIAVDASTTAQAVFPYLKHIPDLTVMTNSLRAGISLLRMPEIHVLVMGGWLRRDAVSLVRQPEDEILTGLNIRIGFFGSRGVTVDQGFTDVNPDEALTKQKMLHLCQEAVMMVDGSKWGQMAVVTFASLNDIHRVITDSSAPAVLVEEVRRRGVDVRIV